ncbi:MAG TPA: hypothetical protein VF516_21010 [Kofleriaceae bacterium]
MEKIELALSPRPLRLTLTLSQSVDLEGDVVVEPVVDLGREPRSFARSILENDGIWARSRSRVGSTSYVAVKAHDGVNDEVNLKVRD